MPSPGSLSSEAHDHCCSGSKSLPAGLCTGCPAARSALSRLPTASLHVLRDPLQSHLPCEPLTMPCPQLSGSCFCSLLGGSVGSWLKWPASPESESGRGQAPHAWHRARHLLVTSEHSKSVWAEGRTFQARSSGSRAQRCFTPAESPVV